MGGVLVVVQVAGTEQNRGSLQLIAGSVLVVCFIFSDVWMIRLAARMC